jgi:hypothetical protein
MFSFACRLFLIDFTWLNCISYTAANEAEIVFDELEGIWKGSVVVHL